MGSLQLRSVHASRPVKYLKKLVSTTLTNALK